MNLIAAVDKNWAIGKDNKLLVQIPMDMKFFRETTTGKVVVMGRKTLESFPNKMPLPKRINIVLSKDESYQVKGAIVVHSKEELLKELKNYAKEDIFIIGGESVYKLMLPYCNVVHVTKIDYTYEADSFFPNLDALKEWKITASSDEKTYFDLEYTFYQYEKKI